MQYIASNFRSIKTLGGVCNAHQLREDCNPVTMIRKVLSLFFLLYIITAFANANSLTSIPIKKCPDCVDCWERCFVAPDDDLQSAYNHIYDIVTAVRAQRSKFGTKGTLYNFDSTSNVLDEREYQKALAALVALTEPVSNDCNPFFLAKFSHFSAW